MERYEIEKLRNLPIEGVAERLGLEVSARHTALCPFHNDHHPSLSFNVRKNSFRCFSCGAHGDVIDLAIKLLPSGRTGVGSFHDACDWLANGSLSLTLPHRERTSFYKETNRLPFDAKKYEWIFNKRNLSTPARKFLYVDRMIDRKVVEACRLNSYHDKYGTDWLQIPYYDVDGKLTGVQWRNLSGGSAPRFKFTSGSYCGIYNLPILKTLKKGEELWIAEGCSDCWSMLSLSLKAIAIPSATLLKPADLEILSTLNSQLSTEFHMAPDKDEPGEQLFQQIQTLLPKLTPTPKLIRHNLPEGCKDFSDYYVAKKRKEAANG